MLEYSIICVAFGIMAYIRYYIPAKKLNTCKIKVRAITYITIHIIFMPVLALKATTKYYEYMGLTIKVLYGRDK